MHRQMNNKGWSRSLLMLTVLAVIAVSCGGESTNTTTAAQGDNGTTGSTSEESESNQSEDLREVTLTLNFAAGGQHVGFVMAQDLGFYEDAGLDVTIQEGQGSQSTAQLVASGQSEFGFADGASTMSVRGEGGDVKIIAPIQQTNAFSVIALSETGISSMEDLEGQTVAVEQGTALSVLLPAVLSANGMTEEDIEIQNVDASALLGLLLEGRVAAILGGAGSQAVQLREQDAEIDVLLFRDLGVPTVGLSMITSDSMIEESPDDVSGFIGASLRGLGEAGSDIEAAADAVTAMFPALDTEQVIGQYEVNEPLFCTEDSETLGVPPDYVWETTYEVMTTYRDLPADQPMGDYYTTDLVPDDVPSC